MASHIERRKFVMLLGGAAAAWPLAADAQQHGLPKVGFLRSGTLADVPHWVTAFRAGLKDHAASLSAILCCLQRAAASLS